MYVIRRTLKYSDGRQRNTYYVHPSDANGEEYSSSMKDARKFESRREAETVLKLLAPSRILSRQLTVMPIGGERAGA